MQHAYVSLLYGPKCHNYFFGALVLGWGLARYGGANIARILMHTADVPAAYIHVLNAAGWNCGTRQKMLSKKPPPQKNI